MAPTGAVWPTEPALRFNPLSSPEGVHVDLHGTELDLPVGRFLDGVESVAGDATDLSAEIRQPFERRLRRVDTHVDEVAQLLHRGLGDLPTQLCQVVERLHTGGAEVLQCKQDLAPTLGECLGPSGRDLVEGL